MSRKMAKHRSCDLLLKGFIEKGGDRCSQMNDGMNESINQFSQIRHKLDKTCDFDHFVMRIR